MGDLGEEGGGAETARGIPQKPRLVPAHIYMYINEHDGVAVKTGGDCPQSGGGAGSNPALCFFLHCIVAHLLM